MNATRRPVIALTGGIAAGKSTVEQRFRAHGICVYDADQAAREVIEPGTNGLAQIVEAFGHEVIGADGRLDRPAMRQRIFADREARHTLESIVHPRVRLWLQQRALADTGPYCMLAIPLLAEHIGHYRWTDRVLLVDVDETTQIRRLMARDDIDETLARRILANQATREQRLAVADDVIDNSGDPVMLDAQVAALHERYLALTTGN
ncbi:dephospho-CoA kinase [Rhodanobacter glycinis]|uniref:Dephospho-CoA kinase n=1 Tax=Rhodanobacter glycinis TaxID=582702 RepID=A0A1I4BEK1_9GAMM|nr:dephospho-CoA kinase [Rhodanobacter glycinis]SFK67272.1 dephospho-CoA kinase [Rhodanobacter glycinis]